MNISTNIARLRAKTKLTQEDCAENIGVSRQAVQKWENGTGTPDIDNLVKIARLFHVSLDELVLGTNRRIIEGLLQDGKLEPDFNMLGDYEMYAGNIRKEYMQSYDEGKDIAAYADLFEEAAKMPSGSYKNRICDTLFDIVMNAPTRTDFPYNEPSDLQAIRMLSKGCAAKKPLPDKETMLDKLKGAWLGRICGCLLGKPVEAMKTEEIHPILKASGNWPLHRYILSTEVPANIADKCWADTIECMPVDDDTNYTVMAQVLIDKYGRDFTSMQMSRIWLDYQPLRAYCTAEYVTYKNFIKGYMPPKSAIYQNPFREWIGAQIRGDYFGYINPGDTELASDMAFRDACMSHTKNGIYGEMFAAAMIAYAAVETDIESIIAAGLGVVPATSRLHEAVSGIIKNWKDGVSASACFARIHKEWDEHEIYYWTHTVSNAMIVAAALLYGEGDYGKSICMAVQTGFDTDCNGATVGSILGMRGGTSTIGEEWAAPVNGQLDTSIFGVGRVSLDEVAKHTMAHMPEGIY